VSITRTGDGFTLDLHPVPVASCPRKSGIQGSAVKPALLHGALNFLVFLIDRLLDQKTGLG
jgi:hypothetical protein